MWRTNSGANTLLLSTAWLVSSMYSTSEILSCKRGITDNMVKIAFAPSSLLFVTASDL